MGFASALGMAEATDLTTAVSWHLQANCYPPIPQEMVPTCVTAIELAAEGSWDSVVPLPEGVTYRDSNVASVGTIVQSHHLSAFVEVQQRQWEE